MAKCIYCNEREANSEEHAIPACLGTDYIRNFELLLGKLCQACNTRIGTYEEQFCRSSPVGFFRRLAGIKGRKHADNMNPYYRGSVGSGPMLAETRHPYFDCMLLCEFKEASNEFTPARQIVVRDSQGNHHAVLIADWVKSAEDFEKALEYKGLSGSIPVEFYATPEEHKWLSDICKGLPDFKEFTELTPVEPVSEKEVVVTIYTTDKFFRAIAKIAFHLFLQYFPKFSGAEKEFSGIRRFIMEGGNVKEWVRIIPGTFLPELRHPNVFINKYAHFITIEKNERHIVSNLLFFVGPEAKPPSYFRVTIGRNPERIYYAERLGHQIVYFSKKEEDGCIGIMQRMQNIPTGLLP